MPPVKGGAGESMYDATGQLRIKGLDSGAGSKHIYKNLTF